MLKDVNGNKDSLNAYKLANSFGSLNDNTSLKAVDT